MHVVRKTFPTLPRLSLYLYTCDVYAFKILRHTMCFVNLLLDLLLLWTPWDSCTNAT